MDLESELVDLLENCLTITTTQEETDFLTELIACLQSEVEAEKEDDDPETCFFREVVQKNPGPNCTLEQLRRFSKSVGLVWKVAEDLDWLLYYVFHRRYGWPDLKEESGYLLVSLPEAQGKFRKSKKSDELRFKARLVELLDVLILWLFHQDASLMAIRMYSSAIRLASNAPVTRHQMVIHSLDWLKERLEEPSEELYEALKDLILLAVTDVWSQVRSAAANRMGPVVDKLSLDQVQNIFEEFARNCEPISNTWQATDGSIAALNALIKRFQRVGYNIGDLSASMSNTSPRIQSQIRFGRHVFDRLPSYIPHRMKSLVFILVNNQQLTIRETVIKAFVNCLNRCSDYESELAFHEVYQRLQSKAMCTAADGECENRCPVLNPSFAFMNPYTAESLLNLCLFLFKRIRDHQSYLENWDIYHNTFDVYLMHPASSVRLATSNLYKYVVARSISNPLLVKNILYCLLRKWQPSQKTLLRPVVDLINAAEQETRRPSVTDFERSFEDEAETWEWREGRLLVYELVCQLLIKNHHLYTFGPPTLAGAMRGAKGASSPLLGPRPASNLRPGSVDDRSRSWDRRSAGNLSSSLSTSDPALNMAKISWTSANKRRASQQEAELRAINLPRTKFKKLNRLPTMDTMTLTAPSAPNMLHQYAQFTTLEPKTRCASFLAHVKAIEQKEKDAEARSLSSGVNSQDSGSLLPNFRSLLCQMFHTCAESLCDPQWELRRMAKQTFACLSELLRWFDPYLLADLVNTHLGCNPTLMTFACLALVKDSLRHTARLQSLVRNPPPSWQGEIAMATVEAVIRSVHDNLAQWLRSCRHYLQRLHFDCVTPITAHVIMLAVIHFSHARPHPYVLEGPTDLDEAAEDEEDEEEVCAKEPTLWEVEEQLPRLTDVQCHVDTVISMFLRLDSVLQQGAKSDIPVYGFEIYPSLTNVPSIGCSVLEFCLHFLEQLGDDLPAFLQAADVLSSVHLLPVLVDWVRRLYRLRTDTTDCLKGLVASLGMLSCKVVERAKLDSAFADIVRGQMERLMLIVSELIEEHIARESWWLRQLLDITIQLLTVVDSDFSSLVAAIVRRLRSGRTGRPEAGREAAGPRNESHLRLFASEAHHETALHESDASEESDEEAAYPESLALRRSRLESGTEGRLSSFAASTSTEPGGSDWDSESEDDDENDLQASLRTAGHFLQKLARCQQERFFEHIMTLENDDQALIRTVIAQSY